MFSENLNKFYNAIEKDIRLKFKPSNLQIKGQEKELETKAKNFKRMEYGSSCSGVSCGVCPFKSNVISCLPVAIHNSIQRSLSEEQLIGYNQEFQRNPYFIFYKAAEFYLKYYCIEYEQEEMDI